MSRTRKDEKPLLDSGGHGAPLHVPPHLDKDDLNPDPSFRKDLRFLALLGWQLFRQLLNDVNLRELICPVK